MNKYDNYVFLTICEVSMKCFEKSVFLSYVNYCRTMSSYLKDGNLNKQQTHDIIRVIEELDLIYSMNDNDRSNYILDYFASDRILDFEKCVRLTKEFYPDFNK